MRILYLTATNSIGAGNRVMLSWISYFLSKNWTIGAICPQGGLLSENLKKTLGKFYLEAEFFNLGKINFLKNLLRIFYFVYKFKPNIIHCNAEISYLYARYIKRILKIPVIVHIRYHFNPKFYSWLFNPKYLPDQIIFVTKSLLIEEKNKIPAYINENILTYLYNTISDPLNKEPSLNSLVFSSSIYKFGCFAPIQKRKNQIDLIKLANKFKKDNINAKIILAGFIREADYFDLINKKIQNFALSSNIQYVGHVDEVFSIMKKMYATISVSRYETFGMSVLESMALGVPVISFYVPAISEILEDSGIIVPFGDVDSLYDACLYLIQVESARLKYSQLGRQRYLSQFTPEKICPQLEKYYLSLLS